MKKKLPAGFLPVLTLAAALAACGSDNDDAPAPAPEPIPAPTPAAGSLKVAADTRVPPAQAQDLRGVTFAKDGKIYVSGHVGLATADRQTVVGRFNADGTPDTTFGSAGFVTINVSVKDAANTTSTGDEQSSGVVELANGDVIVGVNAADGNGGAPITVGAGTIGRPEGVSVVLLRLTNAGAPVATFGVNGKATVDLGWTEADNAAWPAPVANAGGTALVGNGYPRDSFWSIAVDPSASGAGERVVVFGAGPTAPGQVDGAGAQRTDNDRYVARVLAATGAVDPAFNAGKPVRYHSTGVLSDNIRNGSVEADGKIFSIGYTNLGTGQGNHVIALRLLPTGQIDTTFGGFSDNPTLVAAQPGVAVFNPFRVNGGFAEAYGAAKQSDGSYVTTGYGNATAVTTPPTPSTLGYQSSLQPDLVTFRIKGGALDTAWGNNGTQAIQSEGKGRATNEERGRQIVGLPDDRVVQVGRYGGATAIYVFTKDGVLDPRADVGVTELAGAATGDGILELPASEVTAQLFSAVRSADGKRIAATTNTDDTGGGRLVILDVN